MSEGAEPEPISEETQRRVLGAFLESIADTRCTRCGLPLAGSPVVVRSRPCDGHLHVRYGFVCRFCVALAGGVVMLTLLEEEHVPVPSAFKGFLAG